jgi:putative lipoic acid-binding regulatory protein
MGWLYLAAFLIPFHIQPPRNMAFKFSESVTLRAVSIHVSYESEQVKGLYMEMTEITVVKFVC